MAETKKTEGAADKRSDSAAVNTTGIIQPKTGDEVRAEAEARAEASGRALQASETAQTPDEIAEASRTEKAPEANPSADPKPVNDANPDEVTGLGDSSPNYISTRGLNPFQKARANGTPIDGANGAAVLGSTATRTADRAERLAARAAKDEGTKSGARKDGQPRQDEDK